MKHLVLQSQIALHIARAQWWTAYANTPANLERKVWCGESPTKRFLSRDDLIDHAMTTAHAHLDNAQKCLDSLATLSHDHS